MKRLSKILLCLVLAVCVGYTPAFVPALESTPISAVAEAATVKINKKTATVVVGATVKLKISGTSKKVTWSTSKKSVATVSSKGVVTGKKAGKATITAKVNGKKYTCKVTVKDVPKLSKTKSTLYVGNTTTLKVTGTAKKVTWASSNKSVATVSTKGKVTAKKVGTATITAKVGTKKLTCKVTVKKKTVAVTSVNINKSSITLNAGETQKLVATVNPSNATNKTVTWMTENGDVAQIEPDGTVIAVGEGRTKIWAFIGDKTDYCYVSVKVPSVESVNLNRIEMTLSVGETGTLKATINPSNADEKTVIWSSSRENVATVDENGHITALAAGTTTIKAKTKYKSATCTVTVKPLEFGLGEIWTVDGQWRFKVNSVTVHEKCNKNVTTPGEQVVTINYTYWRDGAPSSSTGLCINYLDFDVYDGNGTAGGHYTCRDDLKAEYLKMDGTSCTASEAFILPKTSEAITLVVEQRAVGGTDHQAIFRVPVEGAVVEVPEDVDGYKKLLAFEMVQYGKVNTTNDGEKYYSYEKTTAVEDTTIKCKLLYYPNRHYFEFKLNYPSEDPSRYIYIDMGDAQYTGTEIQPGTVNVYFWGIDVNASYSGQMDLDPTAYTVTKDFEFTLSESNLGATPEYVQQQSNMFLHLAMAGWQDLLASNWHGIPIDLGSLGFSQL
ncbi:MAG: Ig-like domain-containing protein [Eubacteriaceae bacterium]|nr:Ig-like domain-containing protein [Eubacteriaceae bacterium]